MTKKDINQKRDSFYEAQRLVSKMSDAQALTFLNRIIDKECESTLEEAYFRSVAYYVQNKNVRSQMIAASNKKK